MVFRGQVTQVRGLRNPGVSSSTSLIAQNNATLANLINRDKANRNAIVTNILGQVGSGLREKFSADRNNKIAQQQALLKESLPSTQLANLQTRVNTASKFAGDLAANADQAKLANEFALGGFQGGGALGGSRPQAGLQSEKLTVPGLSKSDSGAFQLSASADEGSPRVGSGVPLAFSKSRQDLFNKQQDLTNKQLDAQRKRIGIQGAQQDLTQKTQENEFIFGRGNVNAGQAVKSGQLALDRAGQEIQGLPITPRLISQRKIAKDAGSKGLQAAVETIDGTFDLVENFVPMVEAVSRAKAKGVLTGKTIQEVATNIPGVRRFTSNSDDPDVLAVITYMNSIPALASPVAKAAGESRLTDEDISRFKSIMGAPDLAGPAFEAQSQFFINKVLRQGLNVSAVFGDKSFETLNQAHSQIFGQPFTFDSRGNLSAARANFNRNVANNSGTAASVNVAAPSAIGNISDEELLEAIRRGN